MMYDPKTRLEMVRQRHEELRGVAGRGRLFGRRRITGAPAAPVARPVAPIAPVPDQQAPALPLRLV